MTILSIYLGSLAFLLAGAILPFGAARNNRPAHWLGAGCSILGSSCGIIGAWQGLVSGEAASFSFTWNSAGLPLTINLDGLALFFLLPVFLLVAFGSLYALRYLEFPARGLQAARHWLFFNILAVSMSLVVTAADALTFLLAWELMALSSFLLIISGVPNEKTRKAGGFYLIATHLGTAFLFLLFMEAWYRTGSLSFAAFTSLGNIHQPSVFLFFFLAIIGFGAKAGLFPFHSWLPDAHAAAPSHVSALMSGVMIKTSIYAFLRIMTFLPPLPPWSGLVVIALGLGGALFGIAMASMQTDLKRSLAYSTVENIGIIFLGIGLWLYCSANGNPVSALLALSGSLLHIWNHALFKSLLFMGSGAVLHAGSTLEMSLLGGLMRRMPLTASLMLVGAAAVSALPPLNGLVSELLLFLSLIHAGQTAGEGQAFLFLLFTVLLAMVGGMVVLTMTRIIGIVFGGAPRSISSQKAHEAPVPMLGAMALAAGCCFAIGLFPQAVMPLLDTPCAVLNPGGPRLAAVFQLPFGTGWSLGALTLIVALVSFTLLSRRSRPLPGGLETWSCGFTGAPGVMEYSGGSFAQLAQDELYCSCMRPSVLRPVKKMLFPGQMEHRPRSGDFTLERFFAPLFVLFAEAAFTCRRLQAGRMNFYLTYMFLTTILLLCWNYLVI